ncbi:MAG: hypothetical protein K2N40_00840 [Ureaplasma sp.]|nr:hypothetical protein [Ureaplasma sp.]
MKNIQRGYGLIQNQEGEIFACRRVLQKDLANDLEFSDAKIEKNETREEQ